MATTSIELRRRRGLALPLWLAVPAAWARPDGNTAVRQRLGVPIRFGSCHTATVGGYAIEGHVPAREIHRLLKHRPAGIGLAVPAMPAGSRGMDGPAYGQRKDPYDVLLIANDGSTTTYQRD